MVLTRIKCLLCGTSYKSKFCSSLHKYVHQQNSKLSTQFQCTSCGKCFVKFAGFKSHLQFHGYPSSLKSSASSSEGHNLFAFTNLQKLRRRKSIESSNKLWKSKRCAKKFTESRFLKIHHLLVQEVHVPVTFRQSQKDYTPYCHPKWDRELLSKEELSFTCIKYGERFRDQELLAQRIQVSIEETQSAQNKCKNFFQNQTLQMRRNVHTTTQQSVCTEYENGYDPKHNDLKDCFIQTGELPFTCDKCEKRFHKKRNLNKHSRIHTRMRPNVCNECGKGFIEKHRLTKHMRIHKGNGEFVCEECGKQLIYKQNLVIHRILHTGERPFSCKECGKRFTQKQQLVVHSRVHTKERPFVCSACGKQYAYRRGLHYHKLTHSGERPYVCRECGKGYTSKQSLTNHAHAHTGERPFACDQCEKRFIAKQDLVRHRRTHSKERPFACSECGKKFARKRSLEGHRKLVKFLCDQCGKRFCQKYNLESHRKLHVKEEHALSKTL